MTSTGSDSDGAPHIPREVDQNILPPQASWPGPRRIQGSSPATNAAQEGFDEEIEVHLPDREAKLLVRLANRQLATSRGVLVVLHGAGFTGMSWAPATGVLRQHCCVVAPDLRGHGLSSSTDDNLLSLDSLTSDIVSLLVEMVNSGALARSPRPNPRPSNPRPFQSQREASGPSSAGQSSETSSAPEEKEEEKQVPRGAIESRSGAADSVDGTSECARVESPGDSPGVEGSGGDAHDPAAAGRSREKLGAMEDGVGSSEEPPQRGVEAGGESPIKVLLAGHSLGGSIAVRVAEASADISRRCEGGAEIGGVVAVDVVEGTALAALEDMPHVLSKIPASFPSAEEAVEWHLATGAVRNQTSASIVVPSRLKDDEGGVIWRTDLRKTEEHWEGWFKGLSEAFLALPMPKLLMVAGMDRLDTALTVAHMRGRFQLKLVYGCGHSVQEDQPGDTAANILTFAWRNSILRRGKPDVAARAGDVLSDEEELQRRLSRARRRC